jgi:hypothetical protein
VVRLEALQEDHRSVVEQVVLAVAASAGHRPHERHSAEAHVLVVAALALHHLRAHHLVAALQDRHPVADSVHRGLAVVARLARVPHPAVLVRRAHRLVEAHQVREAPDQAVVSSVVEAVAPAQAVEASLEAARVPVAEVSSAAEAVDVAPADLEAVDDDRFSLCNWRRLGFHNAA